MLSPKLLSKSEVLEDISLINFIDFHGIRGHTDPETKRIFVKHQGITYPDGFFGYAKSVRYDLYRQGYNLVSPKVERLLKLTKPSRMRFREKLVEELK